MSTVVGRAAEVAAIQYLKKQGFSVLDQNWRTRWCEVDIVISKAGLVYFVEVKYRGATTWGGGLDYITPRKLQQMHFAAEFWVTTKKFSGDYQLAAIELTGQPPEVTVWLPEL